MTGRTETAGGAPIVIVDDSPEDIELLRFILRRQKISKEIVEVHSAEAFLTYLDGVEAGERPFPLLVLLDVNLPGMDGHTALAEMRSRPRFREVPAVVMCSHSSSDVDREKARLAGADAYQVKPANLSEFQAFAERLRVWLPGGAESGA